MALRGYIGNTDFDWYQSLAQMNPDEVNFWQPSGGRGFHAIGVGDLFFFRLKKPHYAIAGYGVFAGHSILPAWLAWECFGVKNGATSFPQMLERIERYRRIDGPSRNAEIGCLMIANPVWFDEADWIREPRDWAKNIVQGKTYDLSFGEGARVYEECRARSEAWRPNNVVRLPPPDAPRYGTPTLVAPRLGQGAFRVCVTEAYHRACAVTTEHSLPVLEAAHVRPYTDEGSHDVTNGILLRADVHRLFDRGYVTVTPDYRFEVSPRLEKDWDNGKVYYAFQGQRIHLPADPTKAPDRENLAWHNERVFIAS